MIPPPYRRAAGVLSVAALLVIASAVVLWLGAASVQVANEGRSTIPGAVEFAGEARRYDVILSRRLVQGIETPERRARNVECTASADGDPYVELDGARQGTFTVTDVGASIGSFDGRAGRLRVACRWAPSARPSGHRFIVAEQRTVTRTAGLSGLGLGGLLATVGVLMVWQAARAAR